MRMPFTRVCRISEPCCHVATRSQLFMGASASSFPIEHVTGPGAHQHDWTRRTRSCRPLTSYNPPIATRPNCSALPHPALGVSRPAALPIPGRPPSGSYEPVSPGAFLRRNLYSRTCRSLAPCAGLRRLVREGSPRLRCLQRERAWFGSHDGRNPRIPCQVVCGAKASTRALASAFGTPTHSWLSSPSTSRPISRRAAWISSTFSCVIPASGATLKRTRRCKLGSPAKWVRTFM